MCWKSSKKPNVRKLLRGNYLPVFKVVYKPKEDIISPFRYYIYEIGKVYESDFEVEDATAEDKIDFKLIGDSPLPKYIIEKGLHSYSLDCSTENGIVRSPEGRLLMNYAMEHLVNGYPYIMECRIPKLAKYTKNEMGEMVSDTIETVALYTEEEWKERLNEILKKRRS